jgi:hypothetical protein
MPCEDSDHTAWANDDEDDRARDTSVSRVPGMFYLLFLLFTNLHLYYFKVLQGTYWPMKVTKQQGAGDRALCVSRYWYVFFLRFFVLFY